VLGFIHASLITVSRLLNLQWSRQCAHSITQSHLYTCDSDETRKMARGMSGLRTKRGGITSQEVALSYYRLLCCSSAQSVRQIINPSGSVALEALRCVCARGEHMMFEVSPSTFGQAPTLSASGRKRHVDAIH